jgi:UDPglucose 6-dehydrogenase
MHIAMIGTGYVGLVSGACFADFGHHVTCIDKDAAKIAMIRSGQMPIWEPGLEALVKSNIDRSRLTFTTSLADGIAEAEAVFIAVGTPARRGDGHADLTYVYEAVRELARAIGVHHRSRRRNCRCRGGVHRCRHAGAARRWPCRFDLRL